ncbi:MAG TPA: histidine kinase [Flavitalea sp.]|nr:histidine kinase [Flavitalea sp.]
MKSLHPNSKITYYNIRKYLGMCFITLISISILSYSNIPESISDFIYYFQALIKGYKLSGIAWIVAFLAASIYYPYITFKQKNKTQKLRTKIASDLHDELGSILNSVNIYTDLALIKGEAKYLQKIKESTQEAIGGVRNIIWQLDDKDTSFSNLVSRINSFASFLCQSKQIEFKVEIGKEALLYELHEEEKRNLYMIVKEAINNSIKYANANEIALRINVEKGKPLIVISDDGKGYDSCITPGNGIKNMKIRGACIRYQLSIHSFPGTIIQLRKM